MSVASGRLADRREGGHLRAVAWMITGQASGCALLAATTVHPMFAVVGAAFAFGFGWGWYGIFFMAVARLNPNAPALATGIALSGGAAGGVLGPITSGLIATHASYAAVWTFAATAALLGALMMRLGWRRMVRWRASTSHESADD